MDEASILVLNGLIRQSISQLNNLNIANIMIIWLQKHDNSGEIYRKFNRKFGLEQGYGHLRRKLNDFL